MAICTFFGHRDCTESVREPLTALLKDLILHNEVNTFYVGNQGAYDRIVLSTLISLKCMYPQIDYAVVLAYMPNCNGKNTIQYASSIYPDGLERIHRRYSISSRNQWMVQQADYVITFVTRSYGGAAQFATYAQRHGKIVLNLAEYVKSSH